VSCAFIAKGLGCCSVVAYGVDPDGFMIVANLFHQVSKDELEFGYHFSGPDRPGLHRRMHRGPVYEARRSGGTITVLSGYGVSIRKYQSVASPYRLAVGDVIRCPAFRLGVTYRPDAVLKALPQLGAEPITLVAWFSPDKMQYHINWANTTRGEGTYTLANDDSRGSALFLVTAIVLSETCGPEDVGGPCQIYRTVFCSRLSEGNGLGDDSERISFVQDDPFSVCHARLPELEVVGYAGLPIGWECGEVDSLGNPIEQPTPEPPPTPQRTPTKAKSATTKRARAKPRSKRET
jgi:hypothetical protein